MAKFNMSAMRTVIAAGAVGLVTLMEGDCAVEQAQGLNLKRRLGMDGKSGTVITHLKPMDAEELAQMEAEEKAEQQEAEREQAARQAELEASAEGLSRGAAGSSSTGVSETPVASARQVTLKRKPESAIAPGAPPKKNRAIGRDEVNLAVNRQIDGPAGTSNGLTQRMRGLNGLVPRASTSTHWSDMPPVELGDGVVRARRAVRRRNAASMSLTDMEAEADAE